MPIKNIVTGNNITNQRPETTLVTARPTVFEGQHIGDGVTRRRLGQHENIFCVEASFILCLLILFANYDQAFYTNERNFPPFFFLLLCSALEEELSLRHLQTLAFLVISQWKRETNTHILSIKVLQTLINLGTIGLINLHTLLIQQRLTLHKRTRNDARSQKFMDVCLC